MVRAFAYIRISTDKQVEKKTEQNQEKLIKKYCDDHPDLDLIEIFSDLGKSGASRNRTAFNKMIERLEEVEAILVYDLDRLSRDLEIGLDLMQRLMKHNVKIIELRTKTEKDLSNDSDQLLYMIGAWYSALERRKIKERQKEGIKRYREKNGQWGRKKIYGYNASGKQLTKKQFIDEYVRLRMFKISKMGIARMLGIHIQTLYARLHECQLMEN